MKERPLLAKKEFASRIRPAVNGQSDKFSWRLYKRALERGRERVYISAWCQIRGAVTPNLNALKAGDRKQIGMLMIGAELDLDRALWNMPAAKTKGKKRDHTIPLPAIIVPYLRELKDKHGAGALFPARTGSQHDTLRSISVAHAVARWLTMDGVEMEKFQTRDLRRTWKSRSHDAGVDRFTRDLIQQHAKNDTGSKNYDRADYLPQMREAMDKWSAWLTACVA